MVGGAEAGMDVFHLQGMTTPVMVSGAAVCRGLGVGVGSMRCPDWEPVEPGDRSSGYASSAGLQDISVAKWEMYQLLKPFIPG